MGPSLPPRFGNEQRSVLFILRKFPLSLNSDRWVAFSEFLSQLKKFEWTLHSPIDQMHRHGYETSRSSCRRVRNS